MAELRRWMGLGPPPPGMDEILAALNGAAGSQIAAAYAFGSRLTRSAPGLQSALDLLLIVDRYDGFYQAMRRAGLIHRPARLLAVLNGWLPPNVFYLDLSGPGHAASPAPHAKIMVITEHDLARALDRWAPDHFLLGRLAQRIALVHARGDTEATRAAAYLALAVRRTIDWAAPYA